MMYNPMVEVMMELLVRWGKWLESNFGKYCMHLVFSVLMSWMVFSWTGESMLWATVAYLVLVIPATIYVYVRKLCKS